MNNENNLPIEWILEYDISGIFYREIFCILKNVYERIELQHM